MPCYTSVALYQDRLGTNIGKALKRRVAFCCADHGGQRNDLSPGAKQCDVPSWGTQLRECCADRQLGAKKRLGEQFCILKRSFYQDRLGTNIGKAEKERGVLCRPFSGCSVRRCGRRTSARRRDSRLARGATTLALRPRHHPLRRLRHLRPPPPFSGSVRMGPSFTPQICCASSMHQTR